MGLNETEYTLEDFNYNLPERLIAQNPADKRDASRLFVINRKQSSLIHSMFRELPELLNHNDLLVFNNTKVLNARVYCLKETGGKIEIVLTGNISINRWYVISNRTARLKSGDRFSPLKNPDIIFTVRHRNGDYIEIETSVELTEEILISIGEVPLPPYIKRAGGVADYERYQTVYAEKAGAAAAPTAGLHFTKEIINDLVNKGIEIVYTTLHVSWGTFRPVRDNDLSKHKMHSEKYILDYKTAEKINSARNDGRRIVAIGTTSLRVLESTFKNGSNLPGEGFTDIFIYPPYTIKSADVLFTNFHTPGSTLLMLVSAFAGYDLIMKAYDEAVREEYRFFSYGDAMLIT